MLIMASLSTPDKASNLWNACVHQPFFAIFNVAIAGNMGGEELPNVNTATGVASGMEVAYFACYKSTWAHDAL